MVKQIANVLLYKADQKLIDLFKKNMDGKLVRSVEKMVDRKKFKKENYFLKSKISTLN